MSKKIYLLRHFYKEDRHYYSIGAYSSKVKAVKAANHMIEKLYGDDFIMDDFISEFIIDEIILNDAPLRINKDTMFMHWRYPNQEVF